VDVLRNALAGLLPWEKVAAATVTLAAAVLVGLVVHLTLFAILSRIASRTKATWDDATVKHMRRPSRYLLPMISVRVAVPTLPVSARAGAVITHVAELLLIAAIGYALVGAVRVSREIVLGRYDFSKTDNLSARRVHTQVSVLERVLYAVIVFASISFMLMTFDSVRRIGVSLLASAGVAGVIIGLAAQKSLRTVVAGIQIAITQPIRLDDAVVVEGEFGRVVEITMTYVVVRTWDLRDIVVPITYFIDKPFENWTHMSSQLIGTVMLYVDYSMPIEPIRKELDRLLHESELWDGAASGVQVTDCTAETTQVRLMVSARNPSMVWDLRCSVREQMIEFIQREYPQGLPRVRAEVRGLGVETTAP
jgi:small-conductance mechanosensitive channel